MECPKCHHVSTPTAKLSCSQCGQTYTRESFEEYQHLVFMKEWLRSRHVSEGNGMDALLSEIEQEQAVLLNYFGIQTRPRDEIVRELALIKGILAYIPKWHNQAPHGNTFFLLEKFLDQQVNSLTAQLGEPGNIPPQKDELEEIDYFLESMLTWKNDPNLPDRVDLKKLGNFLTVRKKELLTPQQATRPREELELEYLSLNSAINYMLNWANQAKIKKSYVEQLTKYMHQEENKLFVDLGSQKITAGPPSELKTITTFLVIMKRWYGDKLNESGSAQSKLYSYLYYRMKQLQASPAAQLPVAQVAAKAAPQRKPFEINKLMEKIVNAAVSGALLRGLLYLGAFMIVVSAAVLTILFWNVFSQTLQLLFIASVPTIFYLIGWLVRGKMKLPQTGNVLSGVGALLVAVDFAAVYQFGGLAGLINANLYWMIASLVCLIIYLVTTWRLTGIFFDYISLMAGTSLLVSLTRVVGLPLEWSMISIAVAGAAMSAVSDPLKKKSKAWNSMGIASRHLAQLFLPVSMAAILIFPGKTSGGEFVIYLLAALGYGLFAWKTPAAIFAHASTWVFVGATCFGLSSVNLPLEWFACAAAILGFGYILVGRFLIQKLDQEMVYLQAYMKAVYLAGFVLLIGAALGGLLDLIHNYWAGVTALGLVTLALIGLIFLFQSRFFTALSSAVFLLPFSLTLGRLLSDARVPVWSMWLMTGWVGLGLIYLGLAAGLRKYEKHALWLNVWSHFFTPVALIILLLAYNLRSGSITSALITLTGGILFYLTASVIHDSGNHPALSNLVNDIPGKFRKAIFLWPLGLLIPISLSTAWDGANLPVRWLGAALSGVGLIYSISGWLLGKRDSSYRFPLHVFAYLLIASGIPLATGDSWALFSSLVLGVLVLVSLAWFYRRRFEISLAGLLLIWPFQLLLIIFKITPHAQSLAFSLVASLAYIPAAILLNRGERKFGLPLFIIGYGLSLYALIASILGRFGTYPLDLPWVAAIVPLIITCLYVFSAYHFRSALFSWAAALTLAIFFGQLLTFLHLAPAYDALAWVGLAIIYLGLAWTLKWFVNKNEKTWLASFRWPLTIGAWALTALGLSLTTVNTAWALAGWKVEKYRLPQVLNPVMIAQVVAFGFSLLAARFHKKGWPLYLAPILAFFPTTLFFIVYGEGLFWTALSTSQYGWVWLGLATIFLIAAALLDRNRIRYSHGLYVGGYVLALLALFWSNMQRLTLIYTLAGVILIAVLSQILVHFKLHRSFEDLINSIWRKEGTIPKRTARIGFLFLAVYAFPVWLTQVFAYWGLELPWRGLSLALVAPIYIALGLLLRRVRSEYTWPLYSAAYALTAIGAMLSFEDLRLSIWVLSLDTLVFLASAIIFRQSFWLYLTNVLVPVISLLILKYTGKLENNWVTGIFMGLAFIYIGLGWLLSGRRAKDDALQNIQPFSLPFYSLGYLLSAIALAVASGDKWTALYAFSAGVLLYSFSVWHFREKLFLYPATWLAAVPYFILVSLTTLETRWYGLAWLPLVVACILLGRFVFHRQPIWSKNEMRSNASPFAFLAHPAMPFYLLAYGLSVSMIAASAVDALALTLALVSATVIYLGTVFLMRHPAWLYPGLLAAHLSILAYFAIPPTSGRPTHYISFPFLVMTWVVALIGYLVSRRYPVTRQTGTGKLVFHFFSWEMDFGKLPSIGYLLTPSWSQPIFIFALADIVIWQSVAMRGFETALSLALGYTLLLGLFAILWMDSGLVYASLAFLLLAAGVELKHLGLSALEMVVAFSAIGLILYLLGRLVEILSRQRKAATLWVKPLGNSAILLTTLTLLISLPGIFNQTSLTAGAIACAGALYLAVAYRGRYHRLGYLGMAMLEVAWILALIMNDVNQPQWYAIPTGLYFTVVGILEGRIGRKLFGTILESFGLAVLLITTFIQSLNGAAGFPYFILLLVEGVLIIWWGALRRRKVPLFAGIAASVLNVVAQVVVLVNVYEINRWFIFLAVGVLLITSVVFIERKRENIISQSRTWRQDLDKWD